MAHQGRTSPQLGEKSLTVEKIGVEIGDSKNQVLRYIRLTHLIPELLDLMDEGKIALMSRMRYRHNKKSRLIPAHTYKEGQKGKKKSSVLIQLSGWLRTLDMVPVAGLEPARCRQRWILSPLRLPIPSHRQVPCYYSVLCPPFQEENLRRFPFFHPVENAKQGYPKGKKCGIVYSE